MKSFFFFLCFIFSSVVLAFDVGAFKPNVVDETSSLSPEAIERINQTILKIYTETKVVAAVYIVKELQGASVEDASDKTYKIWKLDKSGLDRGVLILLSMKERESKIKVGLGLQDQLTDFYCRSVIQSMMIPAFRSKKFEEGIDLALKEMSSKMLGQSSIPSQIVELNQINAQTEEAYFRAKLWIFFLWIVPGCVMISGIFFALLFNPQAYERIKAQRALNPYLCLLGVNSSTAFFIKIFVTINPGIFIVIFPVIFTMETKAIAFVADILALICIGIFIMMPFRFMYRSERSIR